MKNMRRMLSLLLALIMSVGCLSASIAVGDAEKYPVSWDLSALYASKEDWQADYDRVEEMIQGHTEYRGKLDNAQTILEYYQKFYMGELTATQTKLNMYAQLGMNLNLVDADYSTMAAMLAQQNSEELQLSAFVEPEILALPLEKREEIFSDPILEPYAYAFRSYTDPDYAPLGEEAQSTLAALEPALNRAVEIYNILNDVELPSPTITAPDGSTITLDDTTYVEIIYSDEYDRDFKIACNQAALEKYAAFTNTFAALLDSCASTYWAEAQLSGYETTRAAAMDAEDVDPAIYDMVLEAGHEGAADYQRYLDAHARACGLDEQYAFDLKLYVSNYYPEYIEYDDAVDDVRKALSVLGDDYIALYDEMVSSSRIDVYPAQNKISGGFSLSINGADPYILLNYYGSDTDVSTLAHEIGHAIYSMMSADTQNPTYANATIFTQEVASTTNELLYYNYKMNNAADDEEKLYYLEELLDMFTNTFFYQLIYAEFEDNVYAAIEAGESLDAEQLSDKWTEVFKTYRGDSVVWQDGARYQWASISHLYYNYYVYKYATDVCYAAAICKAITEKQPNAVENYLDFLKLGSSDSAVNLLSVAGVNPLDESTYKDAMEYFSGLVDEYEAIIDARQ